LAGYHVAQSPITVHHDGDGILPNHTGLWRRIELARPVPPYITSKIPDAVAANAVQVCLHEAAGDERGVRPRQTEPTKSVAGKAFQRMRRDPNLSVDVAHGIAYIVTVAIRSLWLFGNGQRNRRAPRNLSSVHGSCLHHDEVH
jgi:hypothetical protein